MTRLSLLAAGAAALLLAGCFDAPASGDDPLRGAGVKSTATLRDDFACDALLLAADGCPVVRLPRIDSQCEASVEAYSTCAASLDWLASGGSAGETSALVVRVGVGNETTEYRCHAPRGERCEAFGEVDLVHNFTGNGQEREWRISFEARTEPAPPAPAAAAGAFRLEMDLLLRT